MPENLADILSKLELKPILESALRADESHDAIVLQNLDLSTASFGELDLERAYLLKVNLTGVRLTKLRLYQTLFDNSMLSNSDVTAGSFESVEIHRSQATGINLSDAILNSVLFQRCRVNLSQFHESKLTACRFIKCDLREADFQSARLKNVAFRDCDLRNARFPGAAFQQIDLRGSQIAGIHLESKQLQAMIVDVTQLTDLINIFGLQVGDVPSDDAEVPFEVRLL
jgi:uncharacterized protein YjbI with pentapeptide repeats